MLGVRGNREAHGNLVNRCRCTIICRILTDHELLVLIEGLLHLLYRGIPLDQTCVVSIDVVRVLIERIGTITLQLLLCRDHVVLLEALQEIEAISELIDGVVQLSILYPCLVVLLLHVVGEKDGQIECAACHRIVIITELLLEDRTCCEEVCEALRNIEASLLIGRLVVVEYTAGRSYRNTEYMTIDGHQIHDRRIILGKIEVRKSLDIDETGSIRAELPQPVPVDLEKIRLGVTGDLGCDLILPAGPCAVLGLDLYARVGCHILIEHLKGCVMSGVTAPP